MNDIHAVCNRFHLPTPTPDVPLASILDQRGLTPKDLYDGLSGLLPAPQYPATCPVTVAEMIAAAALRGAVQRLPRAAQLDPKPHPKLNHAPKRDPAVPRAARTATPAPAPTEGSPWTRPDAVLLTVAPNPKRPGAANYDRYALYAVGKSAKELRAAGVPVGDLKWDAERGYVTWGSPADLAALTNPAPAQEDE